MSKDDTLDLSTIDPPQWRVQVNDTIYGPYTLGQVQAFARERRIGPGTRISDGPDGEFQPAAEHDRLKPLFKTDRTPNVGEATEPANYLITASLTGTGHMQFVGALNQLGKFAEIMPGVWVLRSRTRQTQVRNRLQATITSGEKVMIVNATTGRLAWLNLGPGADVHIRNIWDAEMTSAS